MGGALDPAVAAAVEDAVGHALPARDDEWAGIGRLALSNARDLTGLRRCDGLELLVLLGCDPVDLTEVAELARLRSLVVRDSGLVSLAGLHALPLVRAELARNLVVDLGPLLDVTTLLGVSVEGNPLSDDSYERVIPALRARGVRVECSQPREWRLTRRLQDAGLPYCCYRDDSGLRLNSPGLRHTDQPEFGHPVVTEDELTSALASDPEQVHALFARRDDM
ncbi:hypothetical protein [Actinokineospora terrae]|uniref:Leucine Rich repeat-containing protein n=1 Tax=Actinokineospora terrae TaxID=155974 RepID=A0A1H9K4S4_9PSEU|nr:hypothetical protein [Actinokineospora terrae]SEQ94256.1 hypothetical protein SAMN04487818_10132 [Actinokineospora terrae]